jgi:hypothetical protein
VEKFPLGETSIIHDGGRISVLLDLSQIEMPPFCQFRFFRMSNQSGERMDVEQVELAGVQRLWVPGGRIRLNVAPISCAHKNPLQLVGSGSGRADAKIITR